MLLAEGSALQRVQLGHRADGRVVLIREVFLRKLRLVALRVLGEGHHAWVEQLVWRWVRQELVLAREAVLTPTPGIIGGSTFILRTEEPISWFVEALLKF